MAATSSRARRYANAAAAGLLLALATPGTGVAVPALMNYQGYITDAANAPRQGTFKMAFSIYPDSTAGVALWSETYASVAVTAGLFNVLLGTVNPLPASVFSGARFWLETAVSDTTLLPRRPLVTVPYSFRSQHADTAAALAVGSIAGQAVFTCGPGTQGILIYVPGRSFVAFAGPSGNFEIAGVPPGTYTVHVESSNPALVTEVTNVVVAAGATTNLGPISLGGTDLSNDPQNCGACGNACSVPNAVANCVSSVCGIASCNTGFGNCDNLSANGCELNLTNNVNNCGACNAVCSLPNATASCVSSVCNVASCNTGFGNCDGIPSNGCERPLNTVINCGFCGVVCPSPPNAAAACVSGICGMGSCNANFLNCDGNTANGCEVNRLTNPNHCGACGNACGGGQTCSMGVCI